MRSLSVSEILGQRGLSGVFSGFFSTFYSTGDVNRNSVGRGPCGSGLTSCGTGTSSLGFLPSAIWVRGPLRLKSRKRGVPTCHITTD